MRKIIPQLLVICLIPLCTTHANELSTKELKAIGEQYIQAWKSGNIEQVKAFFIQPESITKSRFNECLDIIAEMDIDKVRDGYIVLEVERKKNKTWMNLYDLPVVGWEQWLLFTADGKIKYDSILLKHPIEIALKSMLVLYDCGSRWKWAAVLSNSNKLSQNTYTSLKKMGIPMFGLDLSRNPNEIDESLLKMTEWLMDEGDKWDSTEPKVFFPKDLLKQYKKTGKYDH